MIKGLFKRRKKAAVFVDYEYLFYSYTNMVGIRPTPSIYMDELKKEFDISEIFVFGDFSSAPICEELWKLRGFTNSIIETGNTYQRHKKDVTDFVMLDYIHQCMDDRKNIGTYIIFSGDGHFQSVVNRLVQKKKKHVIVYGLKDSLSKQLQTSASEVRFIPTEKEFDHAICKMIAENMDNISGKMNVIPTFNSTIDAIVRRNNMEREAVRKALQSMLDMGYLYQEVCKYNFRQVKVVKANWDKLKEGGYIK